MKRFVLLSMLGLILFSCADKGVLDDVGEDTSSQSSFLSVSILTSNTIGTRGTQDDYAPEGDETDGTYRDGTEAESAVKSILFLFFDEAGNSTEAIKENNGYKNYFLWTPSAEDAKDGTHETETVETILSEKIIKIAVPHNKKKPAQLFVVVNPTNDWETTLKNQSLAVLRNIVADFETDLTGSGQFVMTNSVFVKDGVVVDTQKLTDDDYYTEENAEDHRVVTVYVERILARIDLAINIQNKVQLEDGSYIYYTGESVPEGQEEEGNTVAEGEGPEVSDDDDNVYVKFLGWNVFSTPDKSRLIKKVDSSWEPQDLFGKNGTLPWNSADYHRSFWAINPPSSEFKYKYGTLQNNKKFGDSKEAADDDFNEAGEWTADHNSIKGPGTFVTAYFQENAAPVEVNPIPLDREETEYVKGAPVSPSKVIIAAQLVDKKGKARQLARWANQTYSWADLKTQLCKTLDLWYLGSEEDEDDGHHYYYKKITPDDLGYVANDNDYKVTVVLSQEGEGRTWYQGTSATDLVPVSQGEAETIIAAVNARIAQKVGSVSLWENGYTYFYFDIQHLGEENTPGYCGVVRNHIYEATVTSVKGLGTPVAGDRDIDKLVPYEDNTGVLAAQVKILSWRVVSQNYDLNW